MGDPFTPPTMLNYNANPPADDGSQVESNRVKWSTIKTKLSDPVKIGWDALSAATAAAFAKVVGGGGITSTGVDYQVLSTDQGKLVRASAGGITLTTPDATDVGAPFVFRYLNNGGSDITIAGSGSQTIDGVASITVPPGAGGTLSTDGSNWFTDGQNAARTPVLPQCYLTLIPISSNALSPFPASDQSAKTAVYLRPDNGNLLPIPNGTTFNVREFSELTLTLNSNHNANAIYDVFVFDDDGTLTIGTGPAWNTATTGAGARGSGAGTTELAVLKGLPVNNVSMTARNGSTTYTVDAKCGLLVGSIWIDGSAGQVTCHVTSGQSRKWGVSNVYNRRPITLQASDSTSSWTLASGTTDLRDVNSSSANKVTLFSSLADEPAKVVFELGYVQASLNGGTSAFYQNAIGINGSVAVVGSLGSLGGSNGNASADTIISNVEARYEHAAFIGIIDVNGLESASNSSGTITVNGTSSYMQLTAKWRG